MSELEFTLSNLKGNATLVVRSISEVIEAVTILRELGYSWRNGTEITIPNDGMSESFYYLDADGDASTCLFISKFSQEIVLGTTRNYKPEVHGDILLTQDQ